MSPQSLPVADALIPGMSLGRYELIDRIAVGGMAEIYLARATGIEGFEKLVVLKRILPQFAANEEFVTMFLDEARLSATLQHTNIAQVHDIGQQGGSYFFTMEYIRGEDVRAILKTALQQRKRIPMACSLSIVAGAAAGLHAAHEKCGIDGTALDIVHRDVSPSNVLVSYDGGVKLVDFGVAKAAQRQHETQAGTLKGKVAYMSPEQCTGKPLDRRSDVFALGILLYELTTHRRLFKGDSEFEIMSKIVKQDVEPPSATYGKYPADLEKILLKALKRKRSERYATAQEMQVDIEEFARKHAVALSPVNLASYMREVFVDQMRAQEARIRNRPRTEEVELEISIDEDLSEISGVALAADATPSPSESSTVDRATVPGTRRSPASKPKRWPLAIVVAAAAAGAAFAVTSMQRAPAAQPSAATAVTAPSTAPVVAAETPAAMPSATAPAAAALATPASTSAALAPETASPAGDVPQAASGPVADASSTGAHKARKARKAHKARRSTRPKSKARARAKLRARARAKPRKSSTKPAAKPAKKSAPKKNWQLDSPLPPPRSK